ncbi:hypothetical protein CEXT_808101 [Caerostris extrusa]|uniref:Uncharacterized protein n=1 Tax=Caerostris extrusa TaxID=172846 RepID=A0AAV4WPP3_CAEEX|nr:hypothetical protein CEXT_808101 [Caerostris extrusa]
MTHTSSFKLYFGFLGGISQSNAQPMVDKIGPPGRWNWCLCDVISVVVALLFALGNQDPYYVQNAHYGTRNAHYIGTRFLQRCTIVKLS